MYSYSYTMLYKHCLLKSCDKVNCLRCATSVYHTIRHTFVQSNDDSRVLLHLSSAQNKVIEFWPDIKNFCHNHTLWVVTNINLWKFFSIWSEKNYSWFFFHFISKTSFTNKCWLQLVPMKSVKKPENCHLTVCEVKSKWETVGNGLDFIGKYVSKQKHDKGTKSNESKLS